MIAYNHYIKFIPELKNEKQIEGSYSDVFTIKKSFSVTVDKKLPYELTFSNNQGRDLSLYTDREFSRTQEGQLWVFEVKEVVTFFWHSGTLLLEYIPHEKFTDKLLEYWSLHIVLPIFFTVEERYDFRHAGAVEVEGKPILFTAASFGGKSTMTDFFMKRGHIVVSDDKVATYEKNGQIFALPSHPHHRPYRKMEDLGLFIENFATDVKPIHAVYELEKVEENAKVMITEVTGVEKFISLRYSTEIGIFFQKSKRFEYMMLMAKNLPVFKVKVPWNMDRIYEVHDAIIKHSKTIKVKEV